MAQARAESEASPCEICGKQTDTVTGVSRVLSSSTSILMCHSYSTSIQLPCFLSSIDAI